jgi:glycosyltransferase involved in cell wall biosynthesis
VKIAYVTPGAAGMYCGSCLNDNALASALIRLGHEVALVPVYTPIRTDEDDVSIDRVFYGAISVYLEQRSALFRHTPRVLDRLLAAPRVLGRVSAHGSSIDPGALGGLTLSVLRGEEGNQRKELERLVEWLRDDYRPDLVHLSNSMLVGMARRIRAELGVPVLCSVQGEDIFLEALAEPYYAQVRETLRERVRDADGFVATSRYYADAMISYLQVAPQRMHHVPLGVSLEGCVESTGPEESRFVVGYLARVCPEKGLHLLVEAFRRLADRVGPDRVRLTIAGWLASRDRAYFEGIMERVQAWGLDGIVDYRGEVDRTEKLAFLSSIHVLSVPTVYKEPKGRFVLEALAHGVPVVQPRHGAFPEMLNATGGGLLVDPDSPQALTDGLRALMDDPERRAALGRAGRESVHREFSDVAMASRILDVYRRYLGVEPGSAEVRVE